MTSSYITIDNNNSIKYENLYSINGIIYFITLEDVELPSVKKFTNSYDWTPYVIKFNTEEELTNYINSLENIENIDLSVLADNLWYGNVGHGLFDVLYPIYLALVKFGYEDEPFTFLSMDWSWRENMMYEVIKGFTKQELLDYTKLDASKVYHFKTLVAGTNNAGNRVVNKNVYIHGKEWDGLYKFKKRIFQLNDIALDKPVNIDYPKAIIINNKRFSIKDREVINTVIEQMRPFCDIQFIDWGEYHKYKNDTFKKQMELFQDIDIQITAPGTAMMYVPLLKKGAVNVNIGYIEHTQTNGVRQNLKILESKHDDHLIPAYMEQPICAGTYYVTSLYYDRYKHNELEVNSLIEIIKEAIEILKNRQIVEGNVNIDAKVFREYCKVANDADDICSSLTAASLQVEFFVNEHPYALLPSTDLGLLRSIKDELGYNRNYEVRLN